MPSYARGPYDIFVDSAARSIAPAATASRPVNLFQVNELLDRAGGRVAWASVLLSRRAPGFDTESDRPPPRWSAL
jgi:hypothetical protein